jgi:hypothetical protein
MITRIYAFNDDREVRDTYSTARRDIYHVPVAIVNDDIYYCYRVDVFLPRFFDFLSKTTCIYTVALADNKLYIEYARQFGANITNHPYNSAWKMAEFRNEQDAYTLAKFIAIRENIAS